MGDLQKEQLYYVQWLASQYELFGKLQRRVLEAYPDPREIFQVSKERWEELLPEKQAGLLWKRCQAESMAAMQEQYEKLREQGISFVTREQEEYPRRLNDIPDPPLGLYYKGGLPDGDSLAVAVIGSRDCSEYGSYVARHLGCCLGEQGISVISGMARGIDGISQQAALEAGGDSFGVLGCGVDVCYPQSNQRLYQTLMGHGGILSEYPPGTQPIARNFPSRNRIVSGLATAVVVVEAALKSGTSITVSMALEQGREVYAVPGRITDRLSDGCNRLIKQGAAVYTDPEGFLEELRETYFLQSVSPTKKKAKKGKEPDLREDLLSLWKQLEHTPKTVEEILHGLEASISVQDCTIKLMELVLSGHAKQVSSGHFCKA
jgi:DNA processing protein